MILHRNLVIALSAGVVSAALGACTSLPATQQPSGPLTLCGTFEVVDSPARLVLRDARSGEMFEISVSGSGRAELGNAPADGGVVSLDGKTGCASGRLVSRGRLEVVSRGDIRIHER